VAQPCVGHLIHTVVLSFFKKKLCFSCEIVSLSGCGLMKKSIFKKNKNKQGCHSLQPTSWSTRRSDGSSVPCRAGKSSFQVLGFQRPKIWKSPKYRFLGF